MEEHEVGELLKDLHVMKSHYDNAAEQLSKMKTRLDQLTKQLMEKKHSL